LRARQERILRKKISESLTDQSRVSKKQRIANIFEVAILIFMILLCVTVIMAGQGKVPYIFGYRILQVITDSMEPTISDRTCIIIKQVEQEEIQVGDIITFVSEAPQIKGYLNTHRVHEITVDEESGELLYITKGDASFSPDPYPVEYEQIKGRYVRELPFGELLFRAIQFLMDQVNYFIVVMLPLFLCCMSYIKQLFTALFGKDAEDDEEDDEDNNEEGRNS